MKASAVGRNNSTERHMSLSPWPSPFPVIPRSLLPAAGVRPAPCDHRTKRSSALLGPHRPPDGTARITADRPYRQESDGRTVRHRPNGRGGLRSEHGRDGWGDSFDDAHPARAGGHGGAAPECADLVRDHDWSGTPLGPAGTAGIRWSAATVELVLASPVPMAPGARRRVHPDLQRRVRGSASAPCIPAALGRPAAEVVRRAVAGARPGRRDRGRLPQRRAVPRGGDPADRGPRRGRPARAGVLHPRPLGGPRRRTARWSAC